MGYHSHAWEPIKKTVQRNIEETQALNVPDRTTLWGRSERAYLGHLTRSDSLGMVYTIVRAGRVSTRGVCSPHLTKQEIVILML